MYFLNKRNGFWQLFLLLILALTLVGCGAPKTYDISGKVTDEDGEGIGQVKISITGGTNTSVTTNSEGKYTASELKGSLTITPVKKGWSFTPSSKNVSATANDVDFQGYVGIFIEDENLEELIRILLGIPTGAILEEDVEELEELSANNKGIKSLVGLEHFSNLVDIFLGDNELTDISPLRKLTQLLLLDVRGNAIEDLGPLQDMESLGWLGLRENKITNLGPLANMTELNWLDLWDNEVVDLTPLAGLGGLKNLFLTNNKVVDISVLANLDGLSALYLNNNLITDISALESLVDLNYLKLMGNPLDMEDSETLRILTLLRERGVDLDIQW